MIEEKNITDDLAELYLDLIDGATDSFLNMIKSSHYLEDYPEIKALKEKKAKEKPISQEQLGECVKDYSRKLTYYTGKSEEIVFSEQINNVGSAKFNLMKDILRQIKIPALPLSYNNVEENNFVEKYCLEIKQFVKDYYNYAKKLAK